MNKDWISPGAVLTVIIWMFGILIFGIVWLGCPKEEQFVPPPPPESNTSEDYLFRYDCGQHNESSGGIEL